MLNEGSLNFYSILYFITIKIRSFVKNILNCDEKIYISYNF